MYKLGTFSSDGIIMFGIYNDDFVTKKHNDMGCPIVDEKGQIMAIDIYSIFDVTVLDEMVKLLNEENNNAYENGY